MYELDVAVTHAINGLAGQSFLLDQIMIWLSTLAVPLLVLAVAAQWWPRSERQHERHVLIAVGLSFALGLLINQVILLFLQRVRPYGVGVTHLLVPLSADPSFPSDHATASAAIAAAFLFHGRTRTGMLFAVAALIVMFSRVYIGTHYVSDVLGGAVTATVAAAIVRAAYKEGTRGDRLLTGIL